MSPEDPWPDAVEIDQLESREPLTVGGDPCDGLGPERLDRRRDVGRDTLDGVPEPVEVDRQSQRSAVDGAPRVDRVHPERGKAVVVDRGAVMPAKRSRETHTLKAMRAEATRRGLEGWISPEAVVLGLGATGDVAWFDAGVAADALSGDPLPGHPRVSLLGWGDRVLTGDADDPGSLARAWRELARVGPHRAAEPLGWWGWLGYGAGGETLDAEGEPWATSMIDPDHPDLAFLDVDRALVFDHDTGRVEAVFDPEHEEWVQRVIGWWAAARESGEDVPDPERPPRSPEANWANDDAGYLSLIRRCLSAIHDGDAYQLCLTTSASVRLVEDAASNDLTIYRRLRRESPAPRASFLRIGHTALVGASPETFLVVEADGIVSSSPIKGTRPRGTDRAADVRLGSELRESEKEQAENLMIVDLVRNDLSRVALPGSVEVTELLAVHSYEHVHQLVSTVRARLEAGFTGVDAVRAAFPPGSMTGAPKRSAVGLLASLEALPRGPYSGVAGRFGRDGTVDLAVVIRTIVIDLATRTARVGVGGGITASSDPAAEVEEVHLKARALLDAVGSR
ncbi:MAG: hypothetical protein JWP75_3120 [Frondihabitans sp.]|nr:hypothetical protein [Frondihabitans sp.]